MKHHLFIPILTAAAAISLSAPASAQQASPPRPQAVTQFDDQTIRYLLEDVQATWQVERAADGGLNYRASAEGGINFVAAPRACDEQGQCLGLVLVAVYTGIQVNDPARLDAFVNQYNDQYPTAKVMRNAQGVVALQAYVNAAFGTSYRNVQAQLLVFGQDISNLARALTAFEQRR